MGSFYGTAVMSIVLAGKNNNECRGKNNNECSVGIAPNVMRIPTTQ
jgi:hypothetical protein